MDTISIIGYVSAVVIGLVLGLIGGGGSILTVPVFVYLFHINPVTATAYSLFLVGITSLVGTVHNLRQKKVSPSDRPSQTILSGSSCCSL